jgi:ABC-2 type transport system permease protein
MAELTAGGTLPASMPDIPASQQLLAVAWMRWRIFVNNSFRRRPKTTRQVVAMTFAFLLRLIAWPFIAMMIIGPVVGSGFMAWAMMAEGHSQNLISLLAGVVVLWQFVAINGLSISATISSFDPSSLLRFPLRFGRYMILRTLLGFLTPSTIVGCLALLAAAIGIGVAKPALALPALIVLAVYALMNMFLTRMIGAWMERWLANRRFREIFGVLMAVMIVGVQFLNFERATSQVHRVPSNLLLWFLGGSGPYLHFTPPGFAANAILLSAYPFRALAQFACLLASTALCAGVFAIRMHKQFLGEYLSEGGVRSAPARSVSRAKTLPHTAVAMAAPAQTVRPVFSPVIAACLRKEWLTFRSNSTQWIGLITPLVFIVILNRGIFAQHPAYVLPGAITYVLLGPLAGLYNVFGTEGPGVQIYLLAPIRMRDVIMAKNLASLVLVVSEAGLAWTLVSMLARTPILISTQVSTAFWTVFVIALNLALGTLRSIQAPRKFVPGKAPQRRGTPTGRTSSLLILVVLFVSLFLQIPVALLCRHFDEPWLAAWIFGPLAAAAVAAYGLLLRKADRLILSHRDVFAEELCKV